jgi:hypothetical protein
MGWHIIKRLLQAVPVLLVTLSSIEYPTSSIRLCSMKKLVVI